MNDILLLLLFINFVDLCCISYLVFISNKVDNSTLGSEDNGKNIAIGFLL